MSKVVWKPGTFIYPIPAVMLSCGNMEILSAWKKTRKIWILSAKEKEA